MTHELEIKLDDNSYLLLDVETFKETTESTYWGLYKSEDHDVFEVTHARLVKYDKDDKPISSTETDWDQHVTEQQIWDAINL